MGVHGLWELLAPVGRRVSVETLAGKRLAIDASIWIIQFMKAMRDEKGEMVRNAHILGFFRRICKLLYLRTKPVFVFDGGTPALKRRTVIARRRQRENAQTKIRKTAEKLLLNHLKQMRLQELAADLEKQRRDNDVKGKKPIIEEVPSNENKDIGKGKGKGKFVETVKYNQEELDQMLAASLAAEENEGFITNDGSTSGAGVKDDDAFGDEEEEDDEDEEMIIPEMHGKVDPAVLAALPPSMQLDLLVQMRERLMAENRQKYQKVKKAPSRFSELQIESYLKTVAFRREIDGVQKAASGRGIGGVQTSRIASEANREFIFSSSFTGDKQALASVAQERLEADQIRASQPGCSTNVVNEVLRFGGAETGKKAFHEDVETYRDERGRLRLNKARALGISMTRDLQRNLDLMKEIDQQNGDTNHRKNSSESISAMEISFDDTLENENRNYDDDDDDKLFARLVAGDRINNLDLVKESLNSASDNEWEEGLIENKSVHEVEGDGGEVEWEEGFQDTELKSSSCPDEIITKGVLEEEANIQEAIRISLEETRGCNSTNDFHGDRKMISEEEDDEVFVYEGKEDGSEIEASAIDVSKKKPVMKGAFEEEANIQEAIRISLEETTGCSLMNDFHGDIKMVSEEEDDEVFVYEGKEERSEIEASATDVSKKLPSKGVFEAAANIQEAIRSIEDSSKDHTISEEDRELVSEEEDRVFVYEGEEEGPEIETDVIQPNSTEALESNAKEMKSAEFVKLIPEENNSKLLNQDANASNIFLAGETIEVTFSGEVADNNSSSALVSSFTDIQQIPQAELDYHSCGTAELGTISGVDSITDADGTKELAKEKKYADLSMKNEEVNRNSSLVNDDKDREMTEDRLEEEMLFLGKEREELGSEQRKLERNSESVSGEMFAECQELLQMFGLPYIIAPMEAEAQCAFLELSNLVDGVVTDDSDAFLFGSRSVYKNIFDDRKYVETYFMKDIENELGLDREKIIHMALLLGSDYTEGISGIGIVNAIEVVNAFPGKDGLREFREWIESPDPNILGKLHAESDNSKKKGSKGSENVMNVGSNGDAEGVSCDLLDDAERVKKIFMDKHRNVSKNWHISSSFPSDAVISAYAVPQVDKSTEPFSWGKPDLFVLRKLCWEKFGWGTSKADELLQPVLKEYNKHETQLRLEAFYTFNERFAKIRSKRINKAVKEITKHKSSDLMDETTTPTSGRKRKAKPCGDKADQSGVVSQGLDGAGPANDAVEKPTVKKLRRGQKGSGGRGRGRGQTSGRGRRKKNPSWEEIEIDTSESDEETQIDESEESCRVRRSGRLRKTVNYNVADELDSSDKESDGNRLKESSMTEGSFVDKEVSRVNERDTNELKERSPNFVEDNEEMYERNNPTSNLVEDDDDDKIDEHSKESRSSKDYIQFGGGFCVDEDEEMETNHEKYDGLSFGDLLVKENPEGNNSSVIINEVNTNDETRIDNESDFGGRYSKSLRPMPNLRRKKKRN